MIHMTQPRALNRSNGPAQRLRFVILSAAMVALSLMTFHSNAHADAHPMGSDIGVLGGLAVADQSIGTHLDMGVTGHVQLLPEMNVGFYYQYYWNNYSNVGTTHNHTIAGEMNYLFSGPFDGVYAGGKAGLQLTGNSAPMTQSGTDFVFGPTVGYDYPLGSGLSFGGQFNLLFVTSSPVVTDANILAVLKLNF
jgi:hypothetical protein